MFGLDVERAIISYQIVVGLITLTVLAVIIGLVYFVVGWVRLRREPARGLIYMFGSLASIALVTAACYWLLQPPQPSRERLVKFWDITSSRGVSVLGKPEERGKPELEQLFEGDSGNDIYTYQGLITFFVRLPGHHCFSGQATDITVGVDAVTKKVSWISDTLGPFTTSSQTLRAGERIIRQFGGKP